MNIFSEKKDYICDLLLIQIFHELESDWDFQSISRLHHTPLNYCSIYSYICIEEIVWAGEILNKGPSHQA